MPKSYKFDSIVKSQHFLDLSSTVWQTCHLFNRMQRSARSTEGWWKEVLTNAHTVNRQAEWEEGATKPEGRNIAAQLLTDRATQVRDMFAGVQDFCFQIVW